MWHAGVMKMHRKWMRGVLKSSEGLTLRRLQKSQKSKRFPSSDNGAFRSLDGKRFNFWDHQCLFPTCTADLPAPHHHQHLAVCVCISYTGLGFKPPPSAGWEKKKTQTQMCSRRLKPVQTLSPSDPRPPNDWINKSPLFRIVFGEGIVPAVPPLGPRRQLKRVHFVQHTGGGYEEQMFLSAAVQRSRLKAAHASLKMTGWKVEPWPPQYSSSHVHFWGGGWRFSRRFLTRRAFTCCRPSWFLLQPGSDTHSRSP